MLPDGNCSRCYCKLSVIPLGGSGSDLGQFSLMNNNTIEGLWIDILTYIYDLHS